MATGAVIGFFAGLLGIGGGMTMVPILAALFAAQALAPDHTMHMALATAMAGIMFTSSASVREHHRLGGVDWSIVRSLGPAMALGTLLSSYASGWLPQRALALAFAVIVYGGATQIWLGRKPDATRTLPGALGLWSVGLGIGDRRARVGEGAAARPGGAALRGVRSEAGPHRPGTDVERAVDFFFVFNAFDEQNRADFFREKCERIQNLFIDEVGKTLAYQV